MGNNEKEFVKEVTPQNVDFSQWYLDLVLKTELMDYALLRAVWRSGPTVMLSGKTCSIPG